MYKNNFVASIKCEGKFLSETKNGEVFLPFGSQYNIYLKNLESRKALVSITIDGEDILNGKRLIISGNSILDLDCFVDKLKENRKLKFIEKTKKISDYRGDHIDDGLVVVKFWYEKEKYELPQTFWSYPQVIYTYEHPLYLNSLTPTFSNELNTSCCSLDGISKNISNTISNNISNNISNADLNNVVNDNGITVRGSESNQQFCNGYIGNMENIEYTIILHLKGCDSEGLEVKQVITTKTNKICNICGTSNKGLSKYCNECGAYLK